MKRLYSLLLICALLLSGCADPESVYEKPLTFYYPLTAADYSMGSSFLQPEVREGAGIGGLKDTLNLYLSGPVDPSTYATPFPAGTHVREVTRGTKTLELTMSKEFAYLTGLQLTIACAGITVTCLDLTDVEAVRMRVENDTLDGQEYIEMRADSLLLIDVGKESDE